MSEFHRKPQTPAQFLEQAEETPVLTTEKTVVSDISTEDFPWNSPYMEEITKTFQLRLKMKHLLMLRYIAEHSPFNVSMQKFCIDTLIPAIEQRVKELMKA